LIRQLHSGKSKPSVRQLTETIIITSLPKESDGLKDDSSYFKETPIEKVAKKCGKCNYMKPPGMYVCQKCGHKPIAGQDVECVKDAKLVRLDKKTKEKNYTMEDKQAFYSELKGWQRERKAGGKIYSDGWVANQYKNKFDCWPKGLADTPKPPTPSTRNIIKSSLIRFAKSRKKAEL